MVALQKHQVFSAQVKDSKGAALAPAEERRGSNWIHEALEVFDTPACGYGVRTRASIAAGTTVVMFGGLVITQEEFGQLSYEMQKFPFQVSDELFLGPRDEHDIGVGERINHSCSPNVGFSGTIGLVAIRDISPGEEITLDYATCVASDSDAFVMECRCGSPSCRGRVTGEDWKLSDIQMRLFPHFQPFLQEKIRAQQSGGGPKPTKLSSPENRDEVVPHLRILRRAVLRVGDFIKRGGAFFSQALRKEWMAIPMCVIAGLPSTLATVGIMMIVGPLLRHFEFARDEGVYISTMSLVSSVVGYITYLIAYYAGMLWKERNDWLPDGSLHSEMLGKKLRIVKYDFLAHLPSDIWVMPLIGAATGGLFFAGISQGWSIILANTVADVAYAVKEPFFWHGAKQFVAWQDKRSGTHSNYGF